MAIYAPPAPSRELLIASGSMGAYQFRGVSIEGNIINDYALFQRGGVQTESRLLLPTVRAGELAPQTSQGDHIRIIATVITADGATTQEQVAVNTGVTGTQADLQDPEALRQAQIQAQAEADAAAAAEQAASGQSGSYTDSSLTHPSEAPPPIVQDDAGAYVAPPPENVDPYQGSYTAPSGGGYQEPSGTGSGPDPSNPYGGGQEYGPGGTGEDQYWENSFT